MNIADRLAPLKSLVLTLICQLIGATFASGLGSMGVPFLFLFVIHSFVSGYLSIFLRLSGPWRFINFLIPAGIMVSVAFPGFGWIWLILLVVFGLIFLPTFWTRVPYYPSSQKVYSLLSEELPQQKSFRFLDIGCGDAKLLSFLADRFPLGNFEGVDLSPSAIVAAKMNTRGKSNVKVSLADYWNKSFQNYDFIYAFLSPTPMPKIESKACDELKEDSILFVNTFSLPNLKAIKEIAINDNNQTSLFIYKIENN